MARTALAVQHVPRLGAGAHPDDGIVGLGCPGYYVPAVFESWIKPLLIGKVPFTGDARKILEVTGEQGQAVVKRGHGVVP